MFDKDFFPTPEKVIKEMLKPYYDETYGLVLRDKIILEPSAGKGNILNYIKEHTYGCNFKMYCIEKNDELRAILQDKGYNLIDNDFLTHQPDFNYDLILMNPPFSEGDEHLLHAWDILEEGEIVCLLNEETVKNPYTKKRKLLKDIIDNNGSVEFLGNCFSDSERKTGVNVALIRLEKKSEKNKFSFDDIKDKENINFNNNLEENSLVLKDTIQNICVRYEKVKKDFIELLKYKNKIYDSVSVFCDDYSNLIKNHGLDSISKEEYMNFCQELKLNIWEYIAKETKMEKYMTSKTRNEFNNYINKQGNLAITKENILEFVNIIFQNRFNILDSAIIEVFDIFTKYYEENRCHVEGWKTNDKWKVNRKIILPYWLKWDTSYYDQEYLKRKGTEFKVEYKSEYTDIDKAMCYISGKKYEHIRGISESLQYKFDKLGRIKSGEKFDNTCESTFFNMKFYKKGTLHLEFKDKWLWQEFNMRACSGKKWLPEAEEKTWKESKNKGQQKLWIN